MGGPEPSAPRAEIPGRGSNPDDLATGSVAILAGATWLVFLERIGATLAGVEAQLEARSLALIWHAYGLGLVVCAVVAWLLALVGRHAGRFVPASIAGAVAGIALTLAGESLTSGAWISRQSWMPALRWGLPAVGVLGTVLLGLAWWAPGRRWGRLAALVATALSVALTAGNALVLPGLYPAAHLIVHAVTVICVFLAAFHGARSLLPATGRRLRVVWVAAVLLPLCATMALPLDSGTRIDLRLGSPRAAELLPRVPTTRPDVLRRELETLRAGTSKPRPDMPRGLLPGRPDWNVVLVVVDGLRADALPSLMNTGFLSRRDVPFLERWLRGAFRFRRAYAQATMTQVSMPVLFRSAQPHEDPRAVGDPLAESMAALGHRPLAVVPQYFLEPAAPESQRLLKGFAEVVVYESTRQEDLVPRARELFEANRDRPFFAWLHFFATHSPYYSGPGRRGGKTRSAYQSAVRWLDGELARLDAALRETRLIDRTIVVLTADHGEALGDHGANTHGHNVFECDLRVPLAIAMPGARGASVDAVVGNIDIVPTIFELLGAPANEEHRGKSLVPLMADPARRWDVPQYIRSGGGLMHGIVAGADKLVWDASVQAFFRFDLQRDPGETMNRFDPDSPRDRALVSLLVRENPALMKVELRSRALQSLLLQRLREVDATQPGDALPFLVRLVALSPSESLLRETGRIFARTRDGEAQLLILRHLYRRDRPRLERLLVDHLRSLARSPEEGEAIRGLARQRQPPFGLPWVAERIGALAGQEDVQSWQAWLQLLQTWTKPAASFGASLARMLVRAARDPAVLCLLLENVATLGPGPLPAEIETATLAAIEHPVLDVRVAGNHAAVRVRGARIVALLRARAAARDLDPRERQAILRTMVAVERRRALPLLIEMGGDPMLTLDAVQLARELRDPAALPFLRGVVRSNRPSYVRQAARKAAAALE